MVADEANDISDCEGSFTIYSVATKDKLKATCLMQEENCQECVPHGSSR